MAKPKIFISFDYDNDKHYKYLLNAFSSNSNFDFSFDDKSTSEIKSWNISTIKSVLTRKINEADYTLVIIGSEANKPHKDKDLIGYKNWQNFEVAKSKEAGNTLIGIKIDSKYSAPEEMLYSNAKWAYSFTVDGIINALK